MTAPEYVPDNYDQFERYDRESEERLAKCPKCALCEEPICDDYGYRIYDDQPLYCWDCALTWLHDSAAEYIDIDE